MWWVVECVCVCVWSCVWVYDIIQTPDDSTLSACGVDMGGQGLQVVVTGQPLGGIWQEAGSYLTDLLTATHALPHTHARTPHVYSPYCVSQYVQKFSRIITQQNADIVTHTSTDRHLTSTPLKTYTPSKKSNNTLNLSLFPHGLPSDPVQTLPQHKHPQALHPWPHAHTLQPAKLELSIPLLLLLAHVEQHFAPGGFLIAASL